MPTEPKSKLLKNLQGTGARIAGKFYDWGAAFLDRAARLVQWPRLAPALEKLTGKRRLVLVVELFVALSLTVSFFYLVRPTSRVGPDGDAMSNGVFSYLSKSALPEATQYVIPSWRMRLAGPITSSWLLDKAGVTDFYSLAFERIFGLYHAAWLFLLFLLLIRFRRDALFIMFGTMSGLMYYLSDPVRPQFFVWDIATMFFFTLACLLYTSRRMGLLMLVVWLGALFKETTLCCALLILLGEHWPWRKRVMGFVVTVIATLASYKLLMLQYHITGRVFAMNQATNAHDLFFKSVLVDNVHSLFSLGGRHVLFANAGGLLLMLLIPWRNRRDVIFKVLILVFVVGEFFWGIITEFRIWYEVLPLGWMIVSDRWFAQGNPTPDKEAKRIWTGSYALTLAALLIFAGGICLATTPAPKERVEGSANHMTVTELLVAAPGGNVEAQYKLGMDYLLGTGIERDNFEAAHWFQRAAGKGNHDSESALGTMYLKLRDYTNAVQWFSRAAAGGQADAEFNMGAFYHFGAGVAKDDEKAFEWVQKAALQGQPQAQSTLGGFYMAGTGTKQDYVLAYEWLKLSQRHTDAINPEARQKQIDDNVAAENQLKACAAQMTAEQIVEAEKLVKDFKIK